MALTLTWKPNIGTAIVLNSTSYPLDDQDSPLDFDIEWSNPAAKRFQLPGEHPTFGYPISMTITVQGHILGDDPSDYWTKRKAFLKAMMTPNGETTSRRHGVLTLADDDMDEPAFTYCRIISRSAKLQGLSPSYGPLYASWKSFSPFWIGRYTGSDVVVG